MAVPSEVSSISYDGNNSTVTVYAIPFRFLDNDHLTVTVIDEDGARTELVLDSDYEVAGAGEESGGEMLTTEAVPVTSTVLIERNTPLTNLTEWEDEATWRAATLERNFDKLAMAAMDADRRAADGLARSIRVAPGEELDELPALDDRKGKIPYFNATTGALELKTPAELFELAGPAFTLSIGTVTHLPAGETPTADISDSYPDFTLDLGLPTGATGSIDGGPDCGFGTLPNEDGGQDFALYDETTEGLRRVRLNDSVPITLDPIP